MGNEEELLPGSPDLPTHEIAPLKEGPIEHRERPNTFAAYKVDARNWITLVTGEYYPDVLAQACALYGPVLEQFGQHLRSSESSARLLLSIVEVRNPWMRVQLERVFRRYVSPETPVEMLKSVRRAERTIREFGDRFRPIQEVQAAFDSRPMPDEAICAVFWEGKDRGKKGYDLTERFFALVRGQFPDLVIDGPVRAGRDIRLGEIFPDYPNPTRPIDFVLKHGESILAIGLARYDSDRGGSQEDDRVSGNRERAQEILAYCDVRDLGTKVMFINDGPGLLLGSMWNDYADIESRHPGRVMVCTLRMFPIRVTREWLLS